MATKLGKMGLMAGVASIAMFAGHSAAFAQVAPTNAELAARVEALEAELQDSEVRQAAASDKVDNMGNAVAGWWNDTKVSGRMYFDTTGIENKANGAKVAGGGNGTNFDIKRFYIGVDHTFDPMFSANVTTDVTYDSTTAAGQLYLKKAYLQAKVDPLFIVRVGSADLPWVPYAESIYGYRYLENTLIDRTKFGTSADWGIHVMGSAFDGLLNYAVSAVNGGGYKKIPSGGGTNRFDQLDLEGRVSLVYEGFNVAVGGYTGKLGNPYGTPTYHDANRVDALAAYVVDGLRLGVEYFNATDYSAALVAAPGVGDAANGISGFGSYYFLPQWAVFGRYDSVDTNTKTAPGKNDEYYTFGITWTPAKIIDLSLAYKRENVEGGQFTGSNGAIGATTGAKKGTYSEVGIFGDFQW